MKCPVCGFKVDMFDICDNCNYQNSGPNEKNSNIKGPNKMTLNEAREIYRKTNNIV